MADGPARADLWLAQESPEPEITLVGLPWAPGSPGRALVPLALRERLRRFSTYHSERDTSFGGLSVADAGNWPLDGLEQGELLDHLKARVPDLDGRLLLFIGGADAMTGALVEGLPAETVGVIQFSSRPNTAETYVSGNDVVLIGAQGFAASEETHEAARRSGVSTISNRQIEKEGMRMTVDRALGKLALSEAIHVTVDIDVLDKAHVPGSPDALPGGLTIRQVSDAVRRCGASVKVRSMDFVGADAELDSEQTLDVLAHLILSAVAGYAERSLNP